MTNKRKYEYDYPENREVNAQLNRCDRKEIAEVLRYSDEYVRQVLRGKRKNEEIISMAKQIIEDRKNRAKNK